MAVIHAEIPKSIVAEKLAQGKISPLGPVPQLTAGELDKSVRIVGQMGVEPFIKALEEGAQVIVAGRAYDPAVFAAMAIKMGYDAGLAVHMGKILECACIAAVPGSGSDCMMGYLSEDCFGVEPMNPARKCTTLSVAAHTLYEKSNSYVLPGPGGIRDITQVEYKQETERAEVPKPGTSARSTSFERDGQIDRLYRRRRRREISADQGNVSGIGAFQ